MDGRSLAEGMATAFAAMIGVAVVVTATIVSVLWIVIPWIWNHVSIAIH